MKKEMIAMILAGGQGTRLKSLTNKIAKPAVPFGGKYRIIDFALSNCANSGIDTVGILTQYQPLLLNSHIGIGIPWDFNRKYGGVSVLQPYESSRGANWYLGTANAIYENIQYINSYDTDYVLILSGDHIYKMNYAKMLKTHIDNKADCTISVIKVPMEEASRFGILNTDEELKITSFDEKPEHPKSDLASMGIYIFTKDALIKYLEEDAVDDNSSHDFGKNIIPNMLADSKRLYAYEFEGYWKDVGTIKSLWESNMDLLDRENKLDLYDNSWRIYTKNNDLPAQLILETGEVKNSMVNEGCRIEGSVHDSILFTNVHVEEGAEVVQSVIYPRVRIGKGAKVYRAIVMNDYDIEDNAVIGALDDGEIELVGDTGNTYDL